MPESSPSRLRRPQVFIPLGLLLLVAIAVTWIALDWYWTVPETRVATYVGHEACIECHQEEYELWRGSDHDLAMDHATEETVLADFDDQQFTHVGFDDVLRLANEEVKLAIERVPTKQWAVALENAKDGVAEKVAANMSDEQAVELAHQREILRAVRPCDVQTAHQEITDILRDLQREGKVNLDFATTSKMFRRDGKFFVTTDDAQGKMQTFEVKYVFGVRPLQQYLVEFDDGRIQCLPLTWDTEGEKWYHLYPKEPILHDDPLHWTGAMQNWNYMCAECHTTNLQKNYDLETDTYHTTWSEIDVSCETCHGPGSIHVELAEANSLFWDRKLGTGLADLNPISEQVQADARVQIETCAPCHARRRIVAAGRPHGGKLLDYYLPEILDNNLYYADGQILEEDYVYSSFIQSRMYQEGVRCSDCHDPHSARIKFKDDPSAPIEDNRLCLQCHVAATYDTPVHHHHPDDTQPGTLCVECHMPNTTYMIFDPRRDHSLRVPRPDLTIALDIPNACNGCHDDVDAGETAEWAEAKVIEWYGERKEPQHFAHGFAAAREFKPDAWKQLIRTAQQTNHRPIIRASALSLMSAYPSDATKVECLRGLKDPDELVRVAAIRGLQPNLPNPAHNPQDPTSPRWDPTVVRRMSTLLSDPILAVRTEAARVLVQIDRDALSTDDQKALDAALVEYIAGQQEVNDRPGAHLNMAMVYQAQTARERAAATAGYERATRVGDDRAAQQYLATLRRLTADALKAYRTALSIEPDFTQGRINLARLQDERHEPEAAEENLLAALAHEEKSLARYGEIGDNRALIGEIQYMLGLLVAAQEGRLEDASQWLAKASRNLPDNERVFYNYAVSLQRLKEFAEAERQLKRWYELSRDTNQYLLTAATLYRDWQRWPQALACARQLVERNPNDPTWARFAQELSAQAAAAGVEP